MSVFGKVGSLSVSNITSTGFHASWSPPSQAYPEALSYYDVAVCQGTELGFVVQRYTAISSPVVVGNLTTGYAAGTEYIIGVRAQGTNHTDSGAWATALVTLPSWYVNPFSEVKGLICERVDQGVDFAGAGPILAMGNGVIKETNGPGWPGGPYMVYQLTDGPAAGHYVYVAEDLTVDLPEAEISLAGTFWNAQHDLAAQRAHNGLLSLSIDPYLATITPGATVTRGQPIATMFNGENGIEIGWGSTTSNGDIPESQLAVAASISGANLPSGGGGTLIGRNFEQLLQKLGVGPANNLKETPGGLLPPGWPTWS